MTKIVCDVCGEEATPDAYGLAPDGWVTLQVRDSTRFQVPRDLCGAECATVALRKLLAVTPLGTIHG